MLPSPISLGADTLGTSHLHQAAARARHGATDDQQIAVRVDADYLEPELSHALVAHVPGHAHAFEHARRCRACADRARGPDVVRPVTDRTAVEVVAPDRPLETLALRAAADLDALALLECGDRDLLADFRLAFFGVVQAELGEVLERRHVGLLQVAQPRLLHPSLLGLAEGELDRPVSVAFLLAHGRDPARARLDHGRGHALAVLGENLGHAELASEDAGHYPVLTDGSRCRRRRADGRGAEASRPSWAKADGCRSGACACGSRSARASPCP